MPALQCERALDLHVEHMQAQHTLCDYRRQRKGFNNAPFTGRNSRSRPELIIG
jgi:hypothetical protein